MEEQILPGDALYVVGFFSSYSEEPDLDQTAFELTKQWKRDPARRTSLDFDRNGRLNQKEWLAMHEAARAEVIRRKAQAPGPPHHLIFQPDMGQPFLISSVPPEEVAGRYRYYLVPGLILFLCCGATFAAFAVGASPY